MQLSELPEDTQNRLKVGLKRVIEGKATVGQQQQSYSMGFGGDHYVPSTPPHKYHHDPDPDGTKEVFYWGKRHFFGAAKPNVKPHDPKWALIIDLTGDGWPAGETKTITKSIPVGVFGLGEDLAKELQEYLTVSWKDVRPDPRPHIKIKWPDYGTIPGQTDFWEFLMKSLPKEGNILVNCQGGKGRTGTALAAMFMAANAIGKVYTSAESAIKLLRENHHKNAVESKEQEKYLAELADDWKTALEKKETA